MSTLPATTPKTALAHEQMSASTSTSSNQNLYDLLFTALVQNFPTEFGVSGGLIASNLAFQFPDPTALQQANWCDAVNDANFVIQQFFVGDRAPVLKAGRYTADASSESISQNYVYWINSVVPPSPNSDPAYAPAMELEASYAQDVINIKANAKAPFAAWQAANPGSTITTVNAWLSQTPPLIEAQPFASQYQSTVQKYNTQAALVAQIVENLSKPLSDAMKAANNPANSTTYQYTPSGEPQTSLTAPITEVGDETANPTSDWASWTSGGNQNINPVSVSLIAGTVPVYSVEEVTISVTETFSYFFGLFSNTVTEQETFFEQIVTDEAFELNMQFGSLRNYSISRPGWYSDEVLETYANNAFHSTIDFFNPQTGPLYLIPREVFLGWNPVLVLTVTEALYNNWQKALTSDQGVFVAGIAVGVGMTPTVQTLSNGTVQLTFGNQTSAQSMQQVPTILGFLMDKIVSTAKPPVS